MGRRGLVLLLFGLAWVIQGVAHLLYGPMGTGGHFLHEHLPTRVQGVVWLASGTISAASSLLHRNRSDAPGFIAVLLPPMFLGISYLLGAAILPFFGDPLWPLGLLGFALWGAIALVIGVVASWPEPTSMPPDLTEPCAPVSEGSTDV